ncbi:MAG: transposase zinc-binding domain-containing protein [Deltaproteobacteria bacterium]|nr:transposase zinc-binding domain-containing protein [Deltaproteobacteria bacterium]
MDRPRRYSARDPRSGVLHRLVTRWWPALVAQSKEAGVPIPKFVGRAVERFLVCGVPEAGFVRLRCPDCQVERALAFSCDPQDAGSVARGQDGRSDQRARPLPELRRAVDGRRRDALRGACVPRCSDSAVRSVSAFGVGRVVGGPCRRPGGDGAGLRGSHLPRAAGAAPCPVEGRVLVATGICGGLAVSSARIWSTRLLSHRRRWSLVR